MKVLYFITRSDTVGGAQVHVKDMALAMIATGHDVLVVVGGKGIYFDMLVKLNVPVKSLTSLSRDINIFRDFASIVEYKKIINVFNPDVISMHSAKSGLIGRLASIFDFKTKKIFTAHGWSHIRTAAGKRLIMFKFIEFILQYQNNIITVCRQDEIFALKELNIKASRLITIHNAMPDVNYQNCKPSDGKLRFITTARFQEPKDYLTLISAFSAIKNIGWSLQIIGDGPDFDDIYNKASEFKLLDKITFLGRRDNVSEFLNNADVFLLISNSEGFPRSILEAMRGALPVIATNVGGVKESVINEVNGFVVPPGNVEELSSKIELLIANRQLVAEMSVKSRELYEQKFTFSRMFHKTVDLYKRV